MTTTTMKNYSPFFEVLYDEPAPVGYLGRGTHYSVLRAPVWQDEKPEAFEEGAFAGFRRHLGGIIELIEELYFAGLSLASVRGVSIVLSTESWRGWDPSKWRDYSERVMVACSG
jgi:hypothetical protein